MLDRKCPVPYPRGSWMGNHHFAFHRGTQVELGMDAEWRCVYCGKPRNEYEREQAAKRIAEGDK